MPAAADCDRTRYRLGKRDDCIRMSLLESLRDGWRQGAGINALFDLENCAVRIIENIASRGSLAALDFVIDLAVLFLSRVSANGGIWIGCLEGCDDGSRHISRSQFLFLGRCGETEEQTGYW